jgi:hypothetical protein
MGDMNGLIIYVDWQYFLGILGALIGMAYYVGVRFTKIETTVEWLKEILLEIKAELDRWEPPGTPPSGRRTKRTSDQES